MNSSLKCALLCSIWSGNRTQTDLQGDCFADCTILQAPSKTTGQKQTAHPIGDGEGCTADSHPSYRRQGGLYRRLTPILQEWGRAVPQIHTCPTGDGEGCTADSHPSYRKQRGLYRRFTSVLQKTGRAVRQIHRSENVLSDCSCVTHRDPHLRWQIALPLWDCKSFLRKPTCAS